MHKSKIFSRKGLILTIALILILSTVTVAGAITDGELDGDAHPYVGLLIFDVGGNPAWRCSGTLIAPRVVLTAGHCTSGADGGRIWFESDEAAIRTDGYPFAGSSSIEFVSMSTHPEYTDSAFFVHDAGIVILEEDAPYSGPFPTLPAVDSLDALATQRGRQDVSFTAVGYGLQLVNPVFLESSLDRMVATPDLIQINVPGFTGDFSLLLSNNHATGGTCFGDSGGPNFLGDSMVVGGVTSFGINGNCAGTGGVFRMDRQNVIDYVTANLP